MATKDHNFVAIITAAGASSRLGGDIPKPLQVLNGGITVLEKTLSVFLSNSKIQKIVLTAPSRCFEDFKAVASSCGERVEVIEGGATRQNSVFNALNYISEKYPKHFDVVLIHDAARCLVSAPLLQRCMDGMKEGTALTAALPLHDSIKLVDEKLSVIKSLSRDNVWCIQTPQAFDFEMIYKAHREAADRKKFDFTDDAAMIEGQHEVKIVEGEKLNFKITTMQDLELARVLMLSQNKE